MTFASPSPMQLYSNVASLWREAGADDPLDGIEAMLEMLAIARCEADAESNGLNLSTMELTHRAWSTAREHLANKINLPPPDIDLARLAERSPGLLEQTRRAVSAAAPVASARLAKEYFSALLNFLAHAPQTGLRRTDVGHFTWPDHLGRLFTALLGKPSGKPIYVPFESSGWLPLMLAEAGWPVDCELRNTQVARIFMLFGFLAGWNVTAHVSDPIRRPTWLDGNRLRRFAGSAAIVTFGLRLKDDSDYDSYDRFPVRFLYGEAQQLAHLVAQTRGRAIAVVPEGFLFRTTGGERDYKEQLIRRGMLSAVVRLPRNSFAPYTNVQTSLLIFETDDALVRDVLFVDATDDLDRRAVGRTAAGSSHGAAQQIAAIIKARRAGPVSVLAGYEEIAAQEFNISVDRYVRSEEDQALAHRLDAARTVELNDIAELIRPQSFAVDGADQAQSFAEVGLQDIQSDGTIRRPRKIVEVDDRSLGKVMRQKLEPGDVLLSVRGRIGAVGIVPECAVDEGPIAWLCSQAFVVIRLRANSPVKALTLYRYLASPLGQGLLQSLASGATVPMVSMGDVKKLRVMIPTVMEEQGIAQQYEKLQKLRAQIKQLEQLTEELNASSWPMTRT